MTQRVNRDATSKINVRLTTPADPRPVSLLRVLE